MAVAFVIKDFAGLEIMAVVPKLLNLVRVDKIPSSRDKYNNDKLTSYI
jgi:hypothetical protein